MKAAANPTLRLAASDWRISPVFHDNSYHLSVKPSSGNAATVESLNEKITSRTVGRYRKTRKKAKNSVSRRLPFGEIRTKVEESRAAI
jgi:hypothetical protein